MNKNPLIRIESLERQGYSFEVCVDGFVVWHRSDLVTSQGFISGRYASTVADRKKYRANASKAATAAVRHRDKDKEPS